MHSTSSTSPILHDSTLLFFSIVTTKFLHLQKHPTATEAAMRCNHSKSIPLHHQKHTCNRHTDCHSHITFLRHKFMSLIPTSCKFHRMFPKEQDTECDESGKSCHKQQCNDPSRYQECPHISNRYIDRVKIPGA